MGILLVKLLVALLQDMIWIADMFLDCHGLEVMQSNQYDNANHPLRKATKTFIYIIPFLSPSLLRECPSSLTPPVFLRTLLESC